jgi:thiopeptide-type bacteriocin biosynthesis protein
MAGRQLYQHVDGALVRAARHAVLALPAWPYLTGRTHTHVKAWCEWLREVWKLDEVAEAVEHASPVLARQVAQVCGGAQPDARRARRLVLSMAKYLLRMTSRATPFGLFAGVAAVSFGGDVAVRWGCAHRAVARADAFWLAGVIARLESCPDVLDRLPVVANNTCFVRGGRLVVPYQPSPRGPVEVSIRNTSAVRTAMKAATSPIGCRELAAALSDRFSTASPSAVAGLLADLVAKRALITSLHGPSTVTDAFGHLLEQLDAAEASEIPHVAELLCRLREIGLGLRRHNRAASPAVARTIRAAVTGQMAAVSATDGQPLAVDLRLDCTLALPSQVAREAEAAASALARLTRHPFGAPALQSYHTRFFERYGIGAFVPVLDVVDADVGLGFPGGYAGSQSKELRPSVSARDECLLMLAQTATLDGRDEVVLDDGHIAELAVGDLQRARMPAHIELCFQVHAASEAALGRCDFQLVVSGASRGAGTMSGRFIDVLEPADQQRMAGALARLPTGDAEALLVQLSFPPLDPATANVTRAPEVVPGVISLSEHRCPSNALIRLEDLAVACDSERLYLVSLSLGRRLEPVMLHALDLRAHTPPLARFLAEVSRAQVAVVTGFDWGAASVLPFLPRVRFGRTILSAARWLLSAGELPASGAPWREWDEAVTEWRARRRVPEVVLLTEGDQRLKLDLTEPAHLALLRTQLDRGGRAVLTEAPGRHALGWIGGRAHEIVVPLVAAQPARWPPLPPVTSARVLGRDHGHVPGASPWLYVKLYGHPDRQPEILAEYLPDLLPTWDETPLWWFIRYRDPDPHLRLRIALAVEGKFGPVAHEVSTWAGRLRRLGLLREVQFIPYYPETGRWGSGSAMAASEEVSCADSRALVAQFAEPDRPHAKALCAAHFVAIATGFTGSTRAGMKWLIDHARTDVPGSLPQDVVAEAVRVADPTDDWAALRAAPGGAAIVARWEPRRQAFADYRLRLEHADGIDSDAVLVSLLHSHHIRAAGIDRDDERACLRLARAAAQTWTARRRT